jgi:peptidyl-tRNA hydrolase, PTH1 family
MKLIVGLGNPGREYQETRHNVGFRVADEIAKRRNLQWRADSDWMFAKDFGSPGFLVMKPLTFMNLSGFAVSRFVDYHRIDLTDLLVAFDEVDLEFGRIRVLPSGSAGTHNGMKSIVQQLGTIEFPRLRFGVGRGDPRRDLADYVLSKFEPAEQALLDGLVSRAADAAEMFAVEGISKVMNEYNRWPTDPTD